MRQKNDTLFAWTQFKSNQPSNKASVVRSKDLITKKDEMSILATGKQSLGLFASDLYKMSSPTHSTAEAPFRRWDIYSRVCGGPTFNNLPIQAPLLTILRMIRLEFHSWSFVIVWNIDPFILEKFFLDEHQTLFSILTTALCLPNFKVSIGKENPWFCPLSSPHVSCCSLTPCSAVSR